MSGISPKLTNFQSHGFVTKIPQDAKYQLYICIFTSCFDATPISANNVTGSLTLEKCLFDTIEGDSSGGCLHVVCSNQVFDMIMDKVIAKSCRAENYEGSFAYVKSKGDVSIRDLSIDKCSPVKTKTHNSILLNSKSIEHKGGNATNSYCYCDFFSFELQSETATSKSSWSQFKKCLLDSHGVLVLFKGIHEIRSMSFTDNTQNNADGGGIAYAYRSNEVYLYDSYFSGNDLNIIKGAPNKKITVINCIVDKWVVTNVYSSSGIKYNGNMPETQNIDPIKLLDCATAKAINMKSICHIIWMLIE